MKKIFTSVVMAFIAICVNAQEEVDIPLNAAAWGWGWNSSVTVTDGVMDIKMTGNYGAGSTGWNPEADWSGYSKVCVVIDSYSSGWGQVIIKFSDNSELSQTFGNISSPSTITVDFENNAKASAVKQLSIQGADKDLVIKVSRVYLVKKLDYEDGQNIAFDGSGFINATDLEAFSNSAKVEYTVTANIVTETKYVGWGIGKLQSANGKISLPDFALKNPDGDNVYSCTMKDLRAAIEEPANKDGKKGLEWVIWGQGTKEGNTFTRKSFVVYEVKNLCSVVVGDAGWTTFSYNKPIGLGGVNAYTAKYESGYVTLTKVTAAPAGAGVIIEAPAGTYKIPTLESADALEDNDLLVSDGSVVGDGNIYVLANGKNGIGFYKLKAGDAVPAGKAYLTISSASRDFIGIGGDATGISDVRSNTEKVNGIYFDLSGRRVANPTKGVYIVNGKKVIIK